jgi:hypothetical protein
MPTHPPIARRSNRGRRPRRASALILVILLLVLLGLVGTALVATTRQDRVTSYSYMNNGQVDMYLDGVSNIAKSIIVGDLFGAGGGNNEFEYRKAGTNYRHSTSHQWYDGRWLASRVPEWSDDIRSNKFEEDKFNWAQITLPAHIEEEETIGWLPMISPMDPKAGVYRVNNCATSIEVDGVDYPALRWAKDTTRIPVVIAGDADGDGIADSGLWPLTRQPRDGVSYYGALRIIDNAAAINVNTAYLRDFDLRRSDHEPNRAYFPSNIGIEGVLPRDSAARDFAALNQFRFGNESEPNLDPYDDTGKKHPEFSYLTNAEAIYNNIGARLFNPGYNTYPNRYRPFSSLDQAALGYHFVLPNPDVAPSPIEEQMFGSLYRSASNFDQDPSRMFKSFLRRRNANGVPTESHLELVTRWWSQNFDYDGGKFSARPLLVTTNAVSPAIIQAMVDIDGDGLDKEPANPGMLRYYSRGDWTRGGNYKYGEIVRYNGYHYMQARRNGTNMPPTGKPESNDDWEYQPFSPIASKASLNTATFPELWRNFWAATVADPNGYGSWSLPSNMNKAMTRSPIRRGAAGAKLDANQIVQLRAAQAAVNVMGMRDPGPNVTSRTITLYESGSSNQSNQKYDVENKAKFRVNVFSNKPQPFISEVFVRGDYILIELHNPYPKEIALSGFRFGLVKRQAGSNNFELEDMGEFGELNADVSRAIPPNGYLLFESHADDGRPAIMTAALEAKGESAVLMPELAKVKPTGGNRVLILLRPRKSGGTMSVSTKLSDFHNEGTWDKPNLTELVPLDEVRIPRVMSKEGIRYARDARDTIESAWKITYPGFSVLLRTKVKDGDGNGDGKGDVDEFEKGVPTDPSDMAFSDPKVEWVEWSDRVGDDGKPISSITVGEGQAATYSRTVRLPLVKPEWPGANEIGDAGSNLYPFGTFGYAGDVLKVPYVGACTIRHATAQGDIANGDDAALEMNAPTVDLVLADEDYTKDPLPTTGRFIPPGDSLSWPNNSSPDHWASDVIEYFTTRSIQDDHTPNVLPDNWGTHDSYGNIIRYTNKPKPVANSVPGHANQDEPLVGVEGLVNVNTAPWIVLAQLPLVMTDDGRVDHDKTVYVAKRLAAVNWNGRYCPWSRNGRYETMMELDYAIKMIMEKELRISPPPPDDFERYWANAIRLSNLVTFRSDSFTVYALVEGWRDANTPKAKRVLQRRAAFIVDRSCVTETNREPRIINIATN